MIHIKGIIGEEDNTLISIVAKVQEEKGLIHVLIDSIGGDLYEGISIYKYLKTLNITTECVNNCASAASIIFLAGEKRIAGCPVMIHNPWTQAQGGSSEFKDLAKFLEGAEKSIRDIYSTHTNISEDILAELMDNETYISPSQAVSLGFATEAKQIALALINLNNNNEMSKKKTIFDYLEWLKGKPSNPEIKNMDLTTDDGGTLTVNREEGEPEVGDTASPDGTHLVNGKVIIVEEGVITAINEPSAEGGEIQEQTVEEVTSLLEEALTAIEELQEEVTQLRAQKKEEARILNAVKMAGGIEKLTKGAKSTYTPQARLNKSGQRNVNPLADRLAKLKEERGIN